MWRCLLVFAKCGPQLGSSPFMFLSKSSNLLVVGRDLAVGVGGDCLGRVHACLLESDGLLGKLWEKHGLCCFCGCDGFCVLLL